MKFRIPFLFTLLLALASAGCHGVSPDPASLTQTAESPQTTAALPTDQATPEAVPSGDFACQENPCFFDGHFMLQYPIPAGANQQVDNTYRFGTTQEDLREIHHGVEFSNPSGTPVLSAADGEVTYAGDDALISLGLGQNFYGNVVILKHQLNGIDPPIFTLYAHLSEVSVETGERVIAGQVIGKVGRSGSAIGSHLHFEVRLGENTYQSAVNPELWLTLTPVPNGLTYGALAGRIQDGDHVPLHVSPIRLEYRRLEGESIEKVFTLSTYFDSRVASDLGYQENFAISSLVPGWYRVVFIVNGAYHSEWIEILPGLATFISITLQ